MKTFRITTDDLDTILGSLKISLKTAKSQGHKDKIQKVLTKIKLIK